MKPLEIPDSLIAALLADPVLSHPPCDPMTTVTAAPPRFLDVLIMRNHGTWCLNVYPASSCTAMVADRLDEHLKIWPVALPDVGSLERHMAMANARYEMSVPTDGGLQVRAERNAVYALATWVERLVPVEYPPAAPEVARTRIEHVSVLAS